MTSPEQEEDEGATQSTSCRTSLYQNRVTCPKPEGRPGQRQQGCRMCTTACCRFSPQRSKLVASCPTKRQNGGLLRPRQYCPIYTGNRDSHSQSTYHMQRLCSSQTLQAQAATIDSPYFTEAETPWGGQLPAQVHGELAEWGRIQEMNTSPQNPCHLLGVSQPSTSQPSKNSTYSILLNFQCCKNCFLLICIANK